MAVGPAIMARTNVRRALVVGVLVCSGWTLTACSSGNGVVRSNPGALSMADAATRFHAIADVPRPAARRYDEALRSDKTSEEELLAAMVALSAEVAGTADELRAESWPPAVQASVDRLSEDLAEESGWWRRAAAASGSARTHDGEEALHSAVEVGRAATEVRTRLGIGSPSASAAPPSSSVR